MPLVNKNPACKTCSAARECKDTAVSWFFLFLGLLATLAVRLVNLLLHVGQFWVKLSWYIGVGGFFVYFLYKYEQDRRLRMNLQKARIAEKLYARDKLGAEDYEFLSGLLCRLKSRKDAINYFFIFLSSGIVLALAIYQDFFRP